MVFKNDYLRLTYSQKVKYVSNNVSLGLLYALYTRY